METFSWGLVLCIDIIDMGNKCPSHQALFFTDSFTSFFNLSSFSTSLVLMFCHGGGGEAGGVGWCRAEEEDKYEEDGGGGGFRHGCCSGD